MRKILLFVIVISSVNTVAQNLVPNPSFEDTLSCPTPALLINSEFIGWNTPNVATPDGFHSCADGHGVPTNNIGFQLAHHGLGYVGIFTFSLYYPNSSREYISCKLLDKLKAGRKYSVYFYVSIADNPKYAVSKIGAFFSNDSLYSTDTLAGFIPVQPQIESQGSPLSDKTIWYQISDTMVAVGGEQYLTIGNFQPDSLSDTLFVDGMASWKFSYYFIDDVSVVCLDCTEGINDIGKLNFKIFPNPAKDFLTIDGLKGNETLLVFDLSGRKLIEFENAPSNINVSGLAPGFYLAQFSNSDGNRTIRFVKE